MSKRESPSTTSASSKRRKVHREYPVFHVYLERPNEDFDPKTSYKLTPKPLTLKKICMWCNNRFEDAVVEYGKKRAKEQAKEDKEDKEDDEDSEDEDDEEEDEYDPFSDELTYVVYNVTTSERESSHDQWEDAIQALWDMRIDERNDDREERNRRKALRAEKGDDACSEWSEEEHDTGSEQEVDYESSDEEDEDNE